MILLEHVLPVSVEVNYINTEARQLAAGKLLLQEFSRACWDSMASLVSAKLRNFLIW